MKEPAMNLRFMEGYLMTFIFLRTMVNISETFRPVVMKLKSHALKTSGWVLCHFQRSLNTGLFSFLKFCHDVSSDSFVN